MDQNDDILVDLMVAQIRRYRHLTAEIREKCRYSMVNSVEEGWDVLGQIDRLCKDAEE